MLSIHMSNFDFNVTPSTVPGADGEPMDIQVLVMSDPTTNIQITAAFTEEAVAGLLDMLSPEPETPPKIVVASPSDVPDAAA